MSAKSRGGRLRKMERRKRQQGKRSRHLRRGCQQGSSQAPKPAIKIAPAPARPPAKPKPRTLPPIDMTAIVVRRLNRASYDDQQCPHCDHYPNHAQERETTDCKVVSVCQCSTCKEFFLPY